MMQPINYAKRAKKLREDLTSLIIEQKFTINNQGYFVSKTWMWMHLENFCCYGVGDTKEEAWIDLVESVKKELPNAN